MAHGSFLDWGATPPKRIAQVSISGGEPVRILPDSGAIMPLDVSQDGAQLLAEDRSGTLVASDRSATSVDGQLLRVPILGGSPNRWALSSGRTLPGHPMARCWFTPTRSELFLAKSDGSESRKLVSLRGRGLYPAWSPAGNKLRFTVLDNQTRGNSLWEVSAQGTNLHPLFPGWHNPPDECCGKWTADGKYYVFQSRGQIWALAEKGAFLHQATAKPIQLTSSPLGLFTPVPSKDGKKLFVVGHTYRGELERRDLKSGRFTALSLGHLGRRCCVFERCPVGGLRLLSRRHSLAKQAGW